MVPRRLGTMAESRVRANYVKYAVVRIKQLPVEERDAVFKVLGSTRDEIRAAGLLAWIPMRIYAEVVDSTRTALGSRRAREFWCDTMLSSFERQLLKPLVEGALRLYGRSPASLLRRTPQAWSLVSRHGGRIRLEGDHQVRFDGLPPELRKGGGIVDSMAGNCEAILKYLSRPGSVSAHEEALRQGRIWFDVDWQD